MKIGIKNRIIFVKHFKTSTMNIKHLKTLFIVRDQIEYMMLPVSTVPIRLHGRGQRLADLDLI